MERLDYGGGASIWRGSSGWPVSRYCDAMATKPRFRKRLHSLGHSLLVAATEASSMEMDRRHSLLCSGRRAKYVQTKIHLAAFAEDDVLFNGYGSGRALGVHDGGSEYGGGGCDSNGPEETSPRHTSHALIS